MQVTKKLTKPKRQKQQVYTAAAHSCFCSPLGKQTGAHVAEKCIQKGGKEQEIVLLNKKSPRAKHWRHTEAFSGCCHRLPFSRQHTRQSFCSRQNTMNTKSHKVPREKLTKHFAFSFPYPPSLCSSLHNVRSAGVKTIQHTLPLSL